MWVTSPRQCGGSRRGERRWTRRSAPSCWRDAPRRSPLSALTPREREVLAAMAEGQANAAIARRLVITEKAVGKHIAGIFARLNLPPSGDDHRRVLAVLAYLNATRP